LQHAPRSEHFETLFREAFTSIGHVDYRAERATRESQIYGEAVFRIGMHRQNLLVADGCSGKEPQKVNEMARFPH
jgi:hypothetical protein